MPESPKERTPEELLLFLEAVLAVYRLRNVADPSSYFGESMAGFGDDVEG
jgi:hypothetical protein